MTEREYQRMLEVVDDAINADDAVTPSCPIPPAANDNRMEWSLVPFPEGWTASP